MMRSSTKSQDSHRQDSHLNESPIATDPTAPSSAPSFQDESVVSSVAAEGEAAGTAEALEVVALREECNRLKTERDQLLDRQARLQAEFDNARKREIRERAEFRDYALVNTVEQFLPVLDNFQLALRADGSAEQLRTGVELIVRQMEEILRTLGVQAVPTKDVVFDPRVHEALEMVEREDLPDHQVMEEVRRGYTLRERLLRPALVRVASNARQHKA